METGDSFRKREWKVDLSLLLIFPSDGREVQVDSSARRPGYTHFYVSFSSLQGDHSGCVKPPFDIKTKVPFQYEAHVLRRNLCFGVNRRFDTTRMFTL